MRAPLPFLLLPLAACAPTAESFPADYADVWCERFEECSLGSFEDIYDGDMQECRTSMTDAFVEYAACDFDVEKAKVCLESVRNDTCGDLADGADGCGDVYVCDLGDTTMRRR
jgi:hypothetical protein